MWANLFNYANGVLYHKVKSGTDAITKRWNSRWSGKEAGYLNNQGYKKVKVDSKEVYVSKIVWEMHNGKLPEGLEVDHINSVRDDNRIENLQAITHKENSQRRYSKGYYKHQNKYETRRNGKYLGVFDTPCGAYMAHKTALL